MSDIVQKLKYNKIVMKTYSFFMERVKRVNLPVDVPEVRRLEARKSKQARNQLRCNLLIPSLSPKHVFGGIATALSFYQQLCEKLQCDCRIIVLDDDVDMKNIVNIGEFQLVSWDVESEASKQIVEMRYRTNRTLAITNNDIFMATSWWSAYIVQAIIRFQSEIFGQNTKPLLYLIQDFEPGFYPWSSRYLMAESTYKMDIDVMAVFNSKLLYDYFHNNGYNFYRSWYFEPVLNNRLKEYITSLAEYPERKKQILIYGRPGTVRNAFELIMEALREWEKLQEDVEQWSVISAGEAYKDVVISDKLKVVSIGKVTLEEYAKIMLESKIGISLMVSPHPSYPPLEMSTFGLKVITNSYSNKDLQSFNPNIISIRNCSATNIAHQLYELCNMDSMKNELQLNTNYVMEKQHWENIILDIVTEGGKN